jgi:hypothetical protein
MALARTRNGSSRQPLRGACPESFGRGRDTPVRRTDSKFKVPSRPTLPSLRSEMRIAMHGFDSEFILDLINERQAATGDCLDHRSSRIFSFGGSIVFMA